MVQKENERFAIEQKYRFLIKVGLLICLIFMIALDAVIIDFEAPTELELGILAAVAGIETGQRLINKENNRRRK